MTTDGGSAGQGNRPSRRTSVVGGAIVAVVAALIVIGIVAHGTRTAPLSSPPVSSPAPSTTRPGRSSVTRPRVPLPTAPAIVVLPSVVGLSAAAATTRLNQAGFVAAIDQRASATVGVGRVSATRPAAGSSLATGTRVQVTLSCGQPVPNACQA